MATKQIAKTTSKKTTTAKTKSAKVVKTEKTVKPTKTVKPEKQKETKKPTVTPVVEKTAEKPSVPEQSSLKIKRSYVIIAFVIIAIAAVLYLTRSLFIAAVVNGQPISRFAVVSEVEKQGGKQALDSLVRNALIEQEAQKQGVTVTDKEINDEIKKIEENLKKQGQSLEQALQMQGMTKEQLQNYLRLDKLVGKLVGKDVKVSDDEIKKYMEENAAMLPQGQDEDQLKKMVSEQIKQQKLNDKINSWLQNLQKKANVIYFVSY